MSAAVRCFVAVGIPGRVRDAVAAFLEREGAAVRGVKWVAREQLHFTLKFLGPIAAELVAAAAAALEGALGSAAGFTVVLRGAGAFPSPARPRVVWVGADKSRPFLTILSLPGCSTTKSLPLPSPAPVTCTGCAKPGT